ncbi:carboxypeptidase-like regulatory domain-containing protein [Hyalangium gracile]|uniref:carboxypeptidase-like regulatory domain-containing protein n=1 Tax=Hyalangium gracile TaxID=394092 RepID=UPI001CD02DA1|nr:carboxypeptidase-like regulatory domain-containing protein [Hyalangium gracile]
MRTWVLGIAGAAAIAAIAVLGLSLWREPSPEASEKAPRPKGARATTWARPHAEPTPLPSGSLSIRGVVRDAQGPVAGVRVSATRPTPGETLSELPCPTGSSSDASPKAKTLPYCLDEVGALVLELVSAREGEAPVYAETVTAADGAFVLAGLPEGDFTLWALGEQGAQLQSGVKAGAQAVELLLDEGRMWEGIVVDPEEQPVEGVALTILHKWHTRFFDTRSGEDGRFRIGPLPKGEYALTAEREGWLPTFRSHGFSKPLKSKVVLVRPSRLAGRVLRDGAPAPDVEVSVKAEQCVTFTEQKLRTSAEGRFSLERLGPCTYEFTAERDGLYAVDQVELEPTEPSPELVLNLGQALHMEGTVRDETGQPVEGATVSVSPDRGYFRFWEFVTKADGRYRVGPMEPGTYEFDIKRSGYVEVLSEEHELEQGGKPVDLTLRRAAIVSGVVVDEEGSPVADIRLQLDRSSEDSEESSPRGDTATSDAQGRFSLDAPGAGAWDLRIDDKRFISQRLSIQAPASDLRVILRRGATVVGTVTDEHAVAQASVSVTLWVEVTEQGEASSVRHARTDSQGRFTLRGLRPGRFMVEAKADQDGMERATAKPVELRGTEQAAVALRFTAGRTLSGIVVDGHGEPVADAFIQAQAPLRAAPPWRRHVISCGTGRDMGVHTGPDGRFTLKHLVEGTYELSAWKAGYTFVPARAHGATRSSRDALLVGEGTTEVRVVLERDGRIRGRVVGPDGGPLRHFTVNGMSFSGPTGTFEQSFKNSGVEQLELAAPKLATVLRSVKVQEGVDVELGDVRLGPGRRVTGRVLDAETGAPIADAEVRFMDEVPGLVRSVMESRPVRTGADGTFEFPRVDDRPLTLEAQGEGYRSSRVALGSGEESVTVRLDAGASIELTIRDHEGKPVRANVMFEQEDGSERQVIQVLQGTRVARGVEPGLYQAHVVARRGRHQGIFLPQQVRIPERGQVVVSFVERREGTTLVLRAEGATSAILLPGMAPPPVSEESLSRWRRRGLHAAEEGGVLKFESLPPGRATVLLLAEPEDASTRFHLEELELPAEGMVERVVHPRWQPLPEK